MIGFMVDRLVYIIFALLFVCGTVFDLFFKNKRIKIIVLSIYLLLFFLIGVLKGQTVGLDTQKYTETYNYVSSLESPMSFLIKKFPEITFYSLMILFGNILKLPEICFWILEYGVICIFLFFTFYKQERSLFKFGVFMCLGFLMMSLSGIRQAVAISIGTFAIYNFKNHYLNKNYKKYLFYYLFSILALTIHASSIILFLLPILFLIKWDKKTFAIWVLIFIFVPSILSRIFAFVSSNIYVDYFPYNYSVSITFLLTIFLIVLLFFGYREEKFFTKILKIINYSPDGFGDDTNMIIWIVFYGLIFLSTNVFSLVIPRYSMFLYIGTIDLLFLLITGFKNKKMNYSVEIITMSFFAVYFVIRASTLGIVPYVFR